MASRPGAWPGVKAAPEQLGISSPHGWLGFGEFVECPQPWGQSSVSTDVPSATECRITCEGTAVSLPFVSPR